MNDKKHFLKIISLYDAQAECEGCGWHYLCTGPSTREEIERLWRSSHERFATGEYNLHSDSAHGWVEVEIKKLETLGIADKISGYSYIKGSTAYLEEDCDASLFFKALGYTPLLNDSYTDGESRIRTYQGYNYTEYLNEKKAKAEKRNFSRRAKHEALISLGLNRVRGALGGTYYE